MTRRHMLAIVMLLALGCGGGEKPRVPVSGRVLYRGYVVPSGKIAFTADKDRGTQGPMVSAELRSDGTFRLGEGGLPPGFYRVTIASVNSPVPAKYRDPDLANLVREVVAGKDNVFEIVLDD